MRAEVVVCGKWQHSFLSVLNVRSAAVLGCHVGLVWLPLCRQDDAIGVQFLPRDPHE